MIIFFIFLQLVLNPSFSGTILQSNLYQPIINTITNANQYANYTFNFILETSIPKNSSIEIVFPRQFSSNLGIDIVTNATCSLSCQISSFIIILQFSSSINSGVESSITIYNILNPLSSGGTGNFQLTTMYNSYVFDENKIFGTLGIAPQPGKLTACYLLITNQSQALAGLTTEYRLSFKTIRVVPYQSYMKLTLPISSFFGFPTNLQCGTFTINGMNLNTNIECSNQSDNSIIFTGLTSDIPLGFEVGLKFFLINPIFSGYTGSFVFQIFRSNTQYIYDARSDVPPIWIYPGQMINVGLAAVDSTVTLGLSKVVNFQLTFATSNPVPSLGFIKISFPSTFSLIYNSKIDLVYIVNGISDYNGTVQANIIYDSTQITIDNFQTIASLTTITVQFNAITPSVAGISDPISIQTYHPIESRAIDNDLSNAVITVVNIPASSTIFPNGISVSNHNANGLANTLTFSITPSINVPASGYISIKIPSSFTVTSPAASNCLIDYSGTISQSCTKISNTLLIKLPVGSVYYIGVQNTLKLTGIVTNPSNNGTYLIDISTYSSDGTTLLESFTDFVILSGCLLTTASGYLIGATISVPPNYLYSILVIKFTLQKDLPASTGRIAIKTYPPWDFDLGTGLSDNSTIPCEPISNIANIVCVIKIGSLKSPTEIIVTGFSTITLGTAVEIHFPNLRNPVTAGSQNFDIYLFNITNRIYYVLNYITILVNIYTRAGSYKTTSSIATYTTIPSPAVVSSSFQVSYVQKLSNTIPSNGYLLLQLPDYDVGFFSSATSSTITCQLQSVSYTCKLYPTVQWILISIPSAIVPSTTIPLITIKNLIWPRYYYVPTTGITGLAITSSTYEVSEINVLTNFITHSADTYTKAQVNVDRYQYNSVGCFYNFVFQANNNIPAFSDIYLTFPSIYSLLSSPQPWLIPNSLPSYSQFVVVNLMQVKISLTAAIPSTSNFSFTIAGVKNPGYGSAATGWKIESQISGNLINTYSSLTVMFTLGDLFSPSTITLLSLTANPSNKAIKSTYTFDFKTNIPYILYDSAQIYLIFPSNDYQALPKSPFCNVSLGMTYYDDIELAGASYLITTSQILSNTSQRIKFMIKDITNPSTSGFTDSFSIIIIYDGTIVAQTDPILTNSLMIVSDAGNISISDFNLNPINEAESSVLSISFDLLHVLDSSMIIKLIFPDSYSSKLTLNGAICVGIQSINTELSCWGDDRVLTITNIISSSLLETIIISISNIINPNFLLNTNTGQIALAVQISGDNSFLDYNSHSGFFQLLSAPAYCLYTNITLSNLYSRLETDYTFNLTFYTSIPTVLALGKIIIEFPKQYDIPDNSDLECSVVSDTYGTPSCSIISNIAYIVGNTQEFSGNLLIILNNVQNPVDIGSIDQFFIYSYDGYNSEVLERTYINMGTFSFTFILKGAQVLVNNDNSITIQVGTQSELMNISIQNPSILNLTFKPLVSGFTVIPSSLTLWAGTVSTSFRISIPESFDIGTYYILWETFNDDNLLFTPLRKTTIYVVNTNLIPITMSSIYDLPYLGESLPITFSLPNPPNSEVDIYINFDNSSVIKANPSILSFSSGVTSLSTIFTVTWASLLVNTVLANFTLSGVSSSSYALLDSTKIVNFITVDLLFPSIVSIQIVEIARTYITIVINTNKPVLAYYMLALAGTDPPTFTEVSDFGPPTSLSTESIYAEYVVPNTATITINNLLAQNNYTLFFYIQDQLLRTSGPEIINFQTLDNYRPAEFSIRINKQNPSENEKTWLKQNMAYYLALNITNFEERVYDLGLIPVEYPTPPQSMLYFYLISMPYNTFMPTPLILANSLQAQISNITNVYPNLDSSYTILTAEFPSYVPNIVSLSNITNSTPTTMKFSISLDNYGKVFVLAMPLYTSLTSSLGLTSTNTTTNTTNTTNTTKSTNSSSTNKTTIINNSQFIPTSFQIYKGLDYRNLDSNTIGQSMDITKKNTNFIFEFSNLKPNTSYVLFITVGSVHPYFPDLASNSNIHKVIGSTIPTPITVVASFMEKLQISYIILTILIIIFTSL